MAIPKRGSRSIVVDGVTYRWYVRKKPTYSQYHSVWDGGKSSVTFAVEHAESAGSILVVHLPQDHSGIFDGSQLPILPSQVAQYVSQALASGWKATEAGNPFVVNAV